MDSQAPIDAKSDQIKRYIYNMWPPILGFIVVVGGWEAIIWLRDIPPFIMPSPSAIVAEIVAGWGRTYPDLIVTTQEAVGGLGIGTVVGIILAVIMTSFARIEKVLLPVLTAINAVPVVAYAPLCIMWFGQGPWSKIVLVTFIVSYTIMLNVRQGLRSSDEGQIDLLRSFGATPVDILLKLKLPTALPFLFTGIRVSVVRAMLIAIVVEMIGSYQGIGWRIYEATQQIDFVRVWSAVTVASIVSLLLFGLVSGFQKRFIWWN